MEDAWSLGYSTRVGNMWFLDQVGFHACISTRGFTHVDYPWFSTRGTRVGFHTLTTRCLIELITRCQFFLLYFTHSFALINNLSKKERKIYTYLTYLKKKDSGNMLFYPYGIMVLYPYEGQKPIGKPNNKKNRYSAWGCMGAVWVCGDLSRGS